MTQNRLCTARTFGATSIVLVIFLYGTYNYNNLWSSQTWCAGRVRATVSVVQFSVPIPELSVRVSNDSLVCRPVWRDVTQYFNRPFGKLSGERRTQKGI